MTDLQFSIEIAASAPRVWDRMFDPLAYRDWTRPFAEGSCFEGTWAAGQRLRFLESRGFGMEAMVDECVPHQRVSLRLVGEIREGRPLADSRLLHQPAHERYDFTPLPGGGTRLVVQLQSWDDAFTSFLQGTWPQALQRLKALAEAPPPASDVAATDLPADERTLFTERRLAAPPRRVWQAFADPAQLARWWGPDGFSNEFEHFDFRPGGDWRFWMVGPDGRRYWNESRFDALDAPQRIVLSHVVEPHFTLTVTLAPEDADTRLAWWQCFETAELRRTLEPICRPANEQNLDRLQAVLAGAP